MKTIKSAFLGTRELIDRTPDILLAQLRDVVKEQRALIITRLLGDVRTYLDYKFQISKPTAKQLEEVKLKLLSLKNDRTQLSFYESVIQQLNTRAVVHLTNEPFYEEIDACIAPIIKEYNMSIFKQ